MQTLTDDLGDILADCMPADHARQTSLESAFEQFMASHAERVALLDLGCGDGRAIPYMERWPGRVDYTGVDIDLSPEVLSRTRQDPRIHSYNGTELPFADASFDCVWSKQVLEHVTLPWELLPEILRVLKPGGRLMASASFLEPYHSFSTFGYTPYGLVLLLKKAGFEAIRLRPGIDGVTLALRGFTGRRQLFDRFFESESPLNRLIDRRSRRHGWSVGRTASVKLRYAGQIQFEARRPA